MRKKTALLIVAVICIVGFIFAVSIQPAQDSCPFNLPNGGTCSIHFARSLSCQLTGGVNGIGDYYFDGTLSFGCDPAIP